MKAAEVIAAYAQGRRDFCGESLRGCNFARFAKKLGNGQRQGVELSGADFSGCNIRGANFSYANLTGATFIKAQTGLKPCWVAILLLIAFFLVIIASFSSAINASLVSFILDDRQAEGQMFGWISLVTLLGLMVFTWRKNILAVAVVIAFTGVVSFALVGIGAVLFAFNFAVPFVFAVTISFALAVAIVIVGSFAVAVAVTVAVAVFFAQMGPPAGSGVIAQAGAEAVTVTVAGVLTAFWGWIGWLTLKQEDRDPWLRRIVIATVSIGGTSFHRANLTRTDFTGAHLKNSNFNQATLYKTIFHNAVNLELARPGKTLLANWRVRELLIDPSTGEAQDFTKADLRGANLDNANLKNANLTLADLSQASLVNANLRGANLTAVNAIHSNFRHATLTAACVENWNIDSTTMLDEVDCKYVYLLHGEKERRPSSGEFQPGEFIKLFA